MNLSEIELAIAEFEALTKPNHPDSGEPRVWPHDVTALEALKMARDIQTNTLTNSDLAPHRAAMSRALGWCLANFCTMLDNGIDPRSVHPMKIFEQFESDFKFDDTRILIKQ